MSILNVGHGDFYYCETPHNENMIIDCGQGDVVPSKFLSKVATISELQISHPHTDHFDDIIDISEKKINSFRCPDPNIFNDKAIGWKKSDAAKIKKIKDLYTTIPTNNNAIKVSSDFEHWIWYPKSDSMDPNTSSIITLLGYKENKILMAGDLLAEGWEEMLKNEKFENAIKKTTVLKASHHGRENGFCSKLFDVISPKICIISDKSLDKDNENTSVAEKYNAAVKKGGGGLEFFRISDGVSVGTRYVLTTRNDKSIFLRFSDNGLYIRTNTSWINDE